MPAVAEPRRHSPTAAATTGSGALMAGTSRRTLGGEHGAKVRVVCHNDVWLPLSGESSDIFGAGPGPAREAIAQIPLVAGRVHLLQGQPPSWLARSRRADS